MPESKSIVLDLQKDVMQSDCDIVNILRKAHVIATKLDLIEFDDWLVDELKGYATKKTIPEYRHIRGQLKARNPYRGWMSATIPDDDLERTASERELRNSLAEIIAWLKSSDNNHLCIQISGEEQNLLNRIFNFELPLQFALFIPIGTLDKVVESVKTAVLNWTLKLEKENILGNDMTFTSDEKQAASSIPQTVNNYYGPTNIIGDGVTNCQVIAGNNNQANFSYEYLAKAMSDVQSAIDKDKTISEDDKGSAKELIAMISSKIEKRADPGIINGLFQGLKGILVNALGGVAAGLILSKIQGLF